MHVSSTRALWCSPEAALVWLGVLQAELAGQAAQPCLALPAVLAAAAAMIAVAGWQAAAAAAVLRDHQSQKRSMVPPGCHWQ